MTELGLFPVVSHRNQSDIAFAQKLLELSGDMINFSGRIAYVVPLHKIQGREGVVISDSQDSWTKTTLKVILCTTLIFPILCALIYVSLRPFYSFHVLDIEKELARYTLMDPDTISDSYEDMISELNTPEPLIIYDGLISRPTEESNPLKATYELYKKAQEVCLVFNLDRIKLPVVHFFSVGANTQQNPCVFFSVGKLIGSREYLVDLEVRRQCLLLAARTGCIFDIDQAPCIRDLQACKEPEKLEEFVALLLEDSEDSTLKDEEIEALVQEAALHGLEGEKITRRLRLRKFYEQNSILQTYCEKYLDVDPSLFRESDRSIASALIKYINRSIFLERAIEDKKLEAKRQITYDLKTEETSEQVERILKLLVEAGHIFDFQQEKDDPKRYIIQA